MLPMSKAQDGMVFVRERRRPCCHAWDGSSIGRFLHRAQNGLIADTAAVQDGCGPYDIVLVWCYHQREEGSPGGSRAARMPQFVIEREMPGVGNLDKTELQAASQGSCNVLRDLGPDIQWVHSYVTDDKIYCIYRAPSEDLIRRHAKNAGFHANSVAKIHAVIDPTTAE
jgi:Protein of unknown function (DUF4242)